MARVASARIDENGKLCGGKQGDQTRKELMIQDWYSYPWNTYLVCNDSVIANLAATYIENICNDNSYGYNQKARTTGYMSLLNKTGKGGDFDCSSLVSCCYKLAGINIPYDCTTRTLRSCLLKTGKFTEYTDKAHLESSTYSKRGSIYLKEGSHVVMALDTVTNNNVVVNKETKIITRGIDISSYNKITNYSAIKSDGCDFAIIKIIRKDLNVDKAFVSNLQSLSNVGIKVSGCYNYSYATTVQKAITDAQKVVAIQKQYNTKLTVWMDVEDKSLMNLRHGLIDIINAYKKVIADAGYYCGLYTGQSFYNSYIKPYVKDLNMTSREMWIARYYKGNTVMTIKDTLDYTKLPLNNIHGWQYSSKGKVNGISGNVDLDEIYVYTTTPIKIVKGKVNASSGLKCRDKAITGNVLTVFANGTEVQINSEVNGWYNVTANGVTGWCSAQYIKKE